LLHNRFLKIIFEKTLTTGVCMTVKVSRADRPRPTAPVLGRQKGVRPLAPETFFGNEATCRCYLTERALFFVTAMILLETRLFPRNARRQHAIAHSVHMVALAPHVWSRPFCFPRITMGTSSENRTYVSSQRFANVLITILKQHRSISSVAYEMSTNY
jgi:hypothetical protein